MQPDKRVEHKSFIDPLGRRPGHVQIVERQNCITAPIPPPSP